MAPQGFKCIWYARPLGGLGESLIGARPYHHRATYGGDTKRCSVTPAEKRDIDRRKLGHHAIYGARASSTHNNLVWCATSWVRKSLQPSGRGCSDACTGPVENLGKVGPAAVLAIVYQHYSDDVAFGAGSIRKTPADVSWRWLNSSSTVKQISKWKSENSQRRRLT